jgi:hypothetical protein
MKHYHLIELMLDCKKREAEQCQAISMYHTTQFVVNEEKKQHTIISTEQP